MSKRIDFTPEQEKLMLGMASVGMTHEQIAQACEISTKTLQRKLGKRLQAAKLKGVASVAGALFKNAAKGNVAAQIFIMKTQARWRESGDAATEDKKPQVYEFDTIPKPEKK